MKLSAIFRLAWVLIGSPAILAADNETPFLGVLSPGKALPLFRNTAREDFLRYDIEVRPAAKDAGYESLKFSTTNHFLLPEDFSILPSGPAWILIKSVTRDGDESPVAYFRFNLKRAAPPAPIIGPAVEIEPLLYPVYMPDLSSGRSSGSGHLDAGPTLPPLPPGMVVFRGPLVPPPAPLPGGNPAAYESGRGSAFNSMSRFYNKAGRRSE